MFLENLGTSDTLNSNLAQKRRKTPRCVLCPNLPLQGQGLRGVRALWEDRTESEILDLNLTGLVLAKQGSFSEMLAKSKAKAGMVLPLLLRFDDLHGNEICRQALPLRMTQMGERSVAGMFDAISAGGRLHLSQEFKDDLLLANFHRRNPVQLELQYQNSYWFHGPFDTNLVMTSETSGLLEYDGLLLKWSPQGAQIYKSLSSGGEGESYSLLWTQPPGNKVSMGTSWKERWLRVFSAIILQQNQPILKTAFEQIKAL